MDRGLMDGLGPLVSLSQALHGLDITARLTTDSSYAELRRGVLCAKI